MVEEIFMLILKTSLYASVVGIVVLIVKTALKNRISPRWQYLIWIVLILKLLIPFGPQSALSLFNTVKVTPEQTNFANLHEEYRKIYQIDRQIDNDNTQGFTNEEIKRSSQQFADKAEKLVPYIWISGMASMLIWLMLTNYSLNRRIRKTSRPLPQSIFKVFEDCKRKMGIKKDLQVVVQSTINTPSIFGAVKPKILLSPEILTLNEKDISYILLHELAHYRRRDLITNYLLLFFQSIHWFNPVLWYCFKRMRLDMEVAADEMVLNTLDSREQKEYGMAILSVIENLNFPKLAPRLIGMVDGKKSIEKRLKNIKRMEFFENRRRTNFIIGVLCVVVLSSILLTNGLTRDDSKQEPVKDSVESGDSKENQINTSSLKMAVFHKEYSLGMSNTPGIKIVPEYEGDAEKIEYSTSKGTLLSWDSPMGEITNHGQKVELSMDTPVYWSPFYDEVYKPEDKITVKATVRENDEISIQREVEIMFDDISYSYSVMPSNDVVFKYFIKSTVFDPLPLDLVIDTEIEKRYSDGKGEVFTGGHIILDTEENDGKTVVYALISYGSFGFENGIFTKVSGIGVIPAVFTFEKDEENEYSLIEFERVYKDAIKKRFPKKLWDVANNPGQERYNELIKQLIEKARIYLNHIGRNAIISVQVDKEMLDLDVYGITQDL